MRAGFVGVVGFIDTESLRAGLCRNRVRDGGLAGHVEVLREKPKLSNDGYDTGEREHWQEHKFRPLQIRGAHSTPDRDELALRREDGPSGLKGIPRRACFRIPEADLFM